MARDNEMQPLAVESLARARKRAAAVTQRFEEGDVPTQPLRSLAVAPRGASRVGRVCPLCGALRERGASFCAACGAAFRRDEGRGLPLPATRVRPGIFRRLLAAMLDRLAPLPFVAWLFPAWGALAFAYQLLCDGTPQGRGVGKRAGRLRVVNISTLGPCGVARSMARRLGPALCQLAYCSWEFVWLALVYELASLAFIILNPSGRRLEDYLAGTQVITERAYKRTRRACSSCGEALPAQARHCPRCGSVNDER